MGLHIKKNDETGEIFVSNIGLFLKYFEGSMVQNLKLS